MDPRKLAGLTARQMSTAVIRKFVYRYDEMGFYTVDRAVMKRVVAPGYETRIVSGPEVSLDELCNPNVDQEAIAQLHNDAESLCVLVEHEGAVVGSNWFLRGSVHVHELNRELDLATNVAYSCRTYISPEHRGRHLMGHMMTAFLDNVPDCQGLCGLIYDWNKASIRGCVNLGWQRRGTIWTRQIFGHQQTGARTVEVL